MSKSEGMVYSEEVLTKQDGSAPNIFHGIGRRATAHPWLVVVLWAGLFALAFWAAARAPALLFSGTGDIANSQSSRVDSLLRTDFENPYSQLLALTITGMRANSDKFDTAGDPMIQEIGKRLSGLPEVQNVMTSENVLDKRLFPKPGSGQVILIGLKSKTSRDAEEALPGIRAVVESLLTRYRSLTPGLRWAVTGRAALTYDFNRFNAEDSVKAERRAIPLAILILLLTFGSVVAAGIPLLLGASSTTFTLGLVYLFAHFGRFSNLVQNASGMIGMAVGIDYSLLFIHRYREILDGLGQSVNGHSRTRSQRRDAVVEAMGTAGKTIFYSGITVMIGFVGLTFTPIVETRSIGWGGCLVVLVSVLLALSLLPALVLLMSPVLDWPVAFSRLFARGKPSRKWKSWSQWVTRRAWLSVLVGMGVILLLSVPGVYTRFGLPEGPFVPSEMEFTRGYSMLKDMGLQGVVAPVNIVLTAGKGEQALTPERIPGLYDFSRRIRALPQVAHIFGPVDLRDSLPLEKYVSLYQNMDDAMESVPFVKDFFLSKDNRSMLVQVMLKPDVPLEEAKSLVGAIPSMMNVPGLSVEVGGQAVQNNDFDAAMKSSYGPSIMFVLGVTFAAMMFIFRSPVVAFKALLMNAFSVAAGYGMVVFVLQLGHGHSLFGSPSPSEVVPLPVPLMMFCIMFGLSMDYEVFLLTRIRESYLKSGDNTSSVAEGLAATGAVITSAASIMVAVFGAFAFSRMIVVQMLGLGLGVAVLVDATLIRILLAPAIMKLAGKWNWWPSKDPAAVT